MKILFTVIFILAISCIASYSQSSLEEQNKDVKREEVQRYFGYENLLPAYLTLPIDANLNTNEKGYFVEIGFLLLVLLPILFLQKLKKYSQFYFLFTGIFFFIISVLYASTSYVQNGIYKIKFGNISYYSDSNDSTIEDIYCQLLIGLNNIAKPLNLVLDNFTGRSDYISYPVLILICFVLIYLICKTISTKLFQLLSIFILVYGFYWLILSAGIPWYGYLLFPIPFIFILKELDNGNSRAIKKFGFGMISVWFVIAFVNRVSFYSMRGNTDSDSIGINIVDPKLFKRTLGIESSNNTINGIHPNIKVVQDAINSETESLVLKVGTSLSYFIENNGARLYQDNQLGFFEKVHKRHKTQEEITKALKGEGFKYILADLNTHTLDRTPERTLTKKFNNFLRYLDNNSHLQLLGTDRVIHNNNSKYYYGMSGNIYYNGTYAVYQIL